MTDTRTAIADYELVRLLGEGNYGTFYLAKRPPRLPVDDAFVAVKILAGTTTDDAFRHATRELRVFAAVQSPYMARLFDAGQEGSSFYYAMEYYPLGSLAGPARPLERNDVLRAVAHAARAAHALHEAGIVHRDIKPSNILVTETGGRLSDLGLAQVLNPGQTATGLGSVGSVEFIDPDILRGARASRASDIWSIGVTLHRALTGTGIYGELPDLDPLFALRKVLSSEAELNARLRQSDADVIHACLAPDPTARPPTAAAVSDRIEGLMDS